MNIKIKFCFLILFFTVTITCNAIDTLALQKSMFKVEANFSILIDKNYTYGEARKIMDKPDFQNAKIPTKFLRSFPTYWAGIYVHNLSTVPIELLAETYFIGSWLDDEPQVFCNYDPCPHPRKLVIDEYSHMTYYKIEPGIHFVLVKIADYHLPRNFAPKISTALDYEGNTYIKSINNIILFNFSLGAFAVISIICFSLYLKLRDQALKWYAAYCLVIVISGYFSLQSKYQTFYWSYEFIPWYYVKMFVAMGLYITYVKFGKHFTDTGIEMEGFHKKCDYYVNLCLLLFIPEIILMFIGNETASYIFYYFMRMLMAILGIILIYNLWQHRKNIFALFIIVGSGFLIFGELLSNFVPRVYSAHVATGGAIIDSIIFTIGIAYRIHMHYQRERQLDQELYHKQIEIKSLMEENDSLNFHLLQSQMNPHFIFNALNSINRYILKSEKDKASYYLSNFSKLIRAILDHSNLPEVTLAEEIRTLELYIELENLRFNNMIHHEIFVEDSINQELSKLPPLILQPFIENSILHGFNKINYIGRILIYVKKQEDQLHITIEDNGIGRTKAAKNRHKDASYHVSKGQNLSQERINNYGKLKNIKTNLSIKDIINSANEVVGTRVDILL